MAKQYEVFARKWRPQQFGELVGQDHVVTTLQNAITSNRLAHAYLFVGPRGTGKTSTARIFAKALNCKNGPTITPCHDKDRKKWCDNCREISEGRSLDVLEIDGASNNNVDQVRDLRDTVRYMPAHGKFKIYIIDEVHMLSTAAFNALLKTLEEPPAHVKFFFATTEPQKVLATILSRCQRFDLRRIPAGLIAAHLKKIAAQEKITIEDKAIAAIARGAEGGLRDAESALDQLVSFCGPQINESDVLSVFGLVAHDHVAGLSDAIIDGATNRALGILKALDDEGKDLQRLLTDLLDHFRNLLVNTLSADAVAALDVPETELALLKSQVQRIDSDAILRIIDELAGVENRLRYAQSKRILFEIALVRAIKARDMVGLESVLRKLNELKQQMAGSPLEVAPPPREQSRPLHSPPAAPRHTQPPSTIEEAWQHAAEHLGKVSPLAKTYLASAHPVELRGQTLVVGFDPQFPERIDLVDHPRHIALLQAGLKEKLHKDVTLKLELMDRVLPSSVATGAASPAEAAPSPSKSARPNSNAGDFKDDPLIRKALEIFKGQIIETRK